MVEEEISITEIITVTGTLKNIAWPWSRALHVESCLNQILQVDSYLNREVKLLSYLNKSLRLLSYLNKNIRIERRR